jgi:hypothetical protein
VLKLAPGDMPARLALAVTRYDQRRYEDALREIGLALKAAPENPRARELRDQVRAARRPWIRTMPRPGSWRVP